MDILQNLLDQSQYTFVTAILLGLMTAISPCPLATNITAIGFISQDLDKGKKVFVKGLIYTLGRVFSYTTLAILIYFGASKLNISLLFQGWGEKILGPLMVVIGLFMLDVIKLKFPAFSNASEKVGTWSKTSYWGTFLLGVIFALAFCPYSAVLYFAILIPMTVSSATGLYLPVLFAIATGIPVILFAWFLAFAVGNVAKLYNKIKTFELWFRRIVSVMFILTGIYYIAILFI
mgnify:FL=1